MLKISKPGFSSTWTVNFLMFKLVLEKAEEPEIKLATSAGSWKKQESSRKHVFLLYWLCQAFDCVDHNKLWKILNEMGIPTTWPASWETYMQVRKQQFELDVEQQTVSKQEKEYIKVVYCHPAYLTSMQSTSWETLGWKKHKLESRLPGEISITSDMQMTPPLWQEVKTNYKASWWKWKRRVKKLA